MCVCVCVELHLSEWNFKFVRQHDVILLAIKYIVECRVVLFAVFYVGTWWVGTGSWSFCYKGSCFAVTDKHGKCCFASRYIYFNVSGCNADSLITVFNCSTYLFSSSIACQIESWKNLGFFATLSGQPIWRSAFCRLTKMWSCAWSEKAKVSWHWKVITGYKSFTKVWFSNKMLYMSSS